MASRRDDEASPFGPEHLEGRDVAHTNAEAGVGDLDLLRGVGDHFVGDHHVVVGMGVGNEVVVGVLMEGGDLVDAEDHAGLVDVIDPVPERGADVEAVAAVLGLDEDVRVEWIGHQPTPSRHTNSSKVESSWNPTSGKRRGAGSGLRGC